MSTDRITYPVRTRADALKARRSASLKKYRQIWATMDHTRRGDINTGLSELLDETKDLRRSPTSKLI